MTGAERVFSPLRSFVPFFFPRSHGLIFLSSPSCLLHRPEQHIRAWFSERDKKRENKKKKKDKSGSTAGRAEAPPRPPPPLPPLSPLPRPPIDPSLRSLWFPSAARLEAPQNHFSPKPPSCVLVAFACAGSAEDLWSSEGSGPRRAPSPLLQWLSSQNGKLLSVQLPGRAARRKEAFSRSAAAVAQEVVSLVAAEIVFIRQGKVEGGRGQREEEKEEKEEQIPWFVAGHSMGAWLAFELASAARDAGLHPPERLLLSAMPPPHTPGAERPWKGPAASLPADELVDECRAWGISEAVFQPGVWEEYESLLRNDFRLFDEYVFDRGGEQEKSFFCFPVSANPKNQREAIFFFLTLIMPILQVDSLKKKTSTQPTRPFPSL